MASNKVFRSKAEALANKPSNKTSLHYVPWNGETYWVYSWGTGSAVQLVGNYLGLRGHVAETSATAEKVEQAFTQLSPEQQLALLERLQAGK